MPHTILAPFGLFGACTVASGPPAPPAQPAARPQALREGPAAQCRFSTTERRLLLMANGIGEVLVAALEEAGFHSLEELRRRGTDRVVEDVERRTGKASWHGRAPRLARVLAAMDNTIGTASAHTR